MRVIFMGTPEFAVAALNKIHEAGHEVAAVYTQPDKAKGRSGKLQPPPVKVRAMELGLPVFQPERLREEENVTAIRALEPEIIIVAAYGQILPESILAIPPLGCINIHAWSLSDRSSRKRFWNCRPADASMYMVPCSRNTGVRHRSSAVSWTEKRRRESLPCIWQRALIRET